MVNRLPRKGLTRRYYFQPPSKEELMGFNQRGPLRILLVDDDEEEFLLLREMASKIKRQRYELAWVDSMDKALKAFRGQEYDAFWVDYRLGSANGVELVRELVRNKVNAPIILLTG